MPVSIFPTPGDLPEQLVGSILEKEHRITEIVGRIKALLEKPS